MFRAIPTKDGLGGGSESSAREAIVEARTQLATSTPYSRAGELLKRLADPEFHPYRTAYDAGMNLSTMLETLDPSGDHEGSQLDAFERLVRASGLRLNTDHRRGIFASKLEDFEADRATKTLIPELLSRMYRNAVHGGASEAQVMERAAPIFLSNDYISGSIMRPFAQRNQIIREPIQAAIPVSTLVAVTTGINGDSYRGFYIDQDVDAARMKRVTEAAELPRTKIKGRTQAVNLYKYGRAIEMSYEVLRRMQLDMVAVLVEMMAAQAESDKLGEAIDVLVSGDGNNNAIVTYNQTTIDPAATNNLLTLKGYIGFQLMFETPYSLNVILAQKDAASEILLLDTGSSNLPLMQYTGIIGFGGIRPLNRTQDNIGLGWTSEAPARKLLGIDTGKALERIYEIGASISEVDRFITRQTEVLTLSETEGWAILDKNARRAMDIDN